jgi:hypothetical protein
MYGSVKFLEFGKHPYGTFIKREPGLALGAANRVVAWRVSHRSALGMGNIGKTVYTNVRSL